VPKAGEAADVYRAAQRRACKEGQRLGQCVAGRLLPDEHTRRESRRVKETGSKGSVLFNGKKLILRFTVCEELWEAACADHTCGKRIHLVRVVVCMADEQHVLVRQIDVDTSLQEVLSADRRRRSNSAHPCCCCGRIRMPTRAARCCRIWWRC